MWPLLIRSTALFACVWFMVPAVTRVLRRPDNWPRTWLPNIVLSQFLAFARSETLVPFFSSALSASGVRPRAAASDSKTALAIARCAALSAGEALVATAVAVADGVDWARTLTAPRLNRAAAEAAPTNLTAAPAHQVIPTLSISVWLQDPNLNRGSR